MLHACLCVMSQPEGFLLSSSRQVVVMTFANALLNEQSEMLFAPNASCEVQSVAL
jgi:hypothetical protein